MIFKVLGYVRLCWILLSRPEEGLRGFGGLAERRSRTIFDTENPLRKQ